MGRTLSGLQMDKWLAASCSRQVRVFNEDGQEIWQSDDHPSTVSTDRLVRFNGIGNGLLRILVSFFEAASGKLSQKLEWQGSLVSMVLSPDGDIVCGSQDNTVHFWRRSSGKLHDVRVRW